jgi:hypothetical protein
MWRMNISLEEAIALLEGWQKAGTEVRLHLSTQKGNREMRAVITSLAGSKVNIVADTEILTLDLKEAEFNGDRRSSPQTNQGPYLVCEFRNDDRWSFRAPQSVSTVQKERRRVE